MLMLILPLLAFADVAIATMLLLPLLAFADVAEEKLCAFLERHFLVGSIHYLGGRSC